MEESPLAISDRIKLPTEIWCRNIEIATAIATGMTDNRIKTIWYKFVRLTVQIGCMIARPVDSKAISSATCEA